jgi:hypothetical protein
MPKRRHWIGSRLIALALTGVVVLGVTAVALAKDPWHARYSGAPSSGGTLGFKTKSTHGGKHVVSGFKFSGLTVACTDNPAVPSDSTAGDVPRTIKLDGNHFQFQATANQAEFQSTLSLTGKLTHHRKKAAGTLRVSGALVPVASGNPRPCDSGVVDWTAKRK